MKSIIEKKIFDLNSLFPIPKFLVLEVTPRYNYDNGVKTDVVEGYNYDVINLGSYDTMRVFIEGANAPLIENDKLQNMRESGKQLFVEFDNARIRVYYNSKTRQLADSIKADAIRVVKES